MRITVSIEDDVMERLRQYAMARSMTLSSAASELLKRALDAEVPAKWENGIQIFSPGPGGAITAEHVMKLRDEMEDELV